MSMAQDLMRGVFASTFLNGGELYKADKQNELYRAKMKDMQSFLDSYRAKNHIQHRSIKHPYMGIPGEMQLLSTGIDINDTVPEMNMFRSLGHFARPMAIGYSARGQSLHKWL